MLTYYVMGAAFACISFSSVIDSFTKTWQVSLLAATGVAAGSAVMLFDIAASEVNVVLTCLC